MDLPDRLEDHVPVRTTKVGRRTQTSNGILFGISVIDHDISSIVGLDFSGEVLFITLVWKSTGTGMGAYSMDLNMILQILSLDSQK